MEVHPICVLLEFHNNKMTVKKKKYILYKLLPSAYMQKAITKSN